MKKTMFTLFSAMILLLSSCKKEGVNQNLKKAWFVSTLAGAGAPGYVDGKGELSALSTPAGITVDLSGNIFIADQQNHCIRKITPDGTVTTIAGKGGANGGEQGYIDAQGTAARFNQPFDVKVDRKGNLYVADAGNNCIRKITLAGVVSTFAGNGDYDYADGTGTDARFAYPTGLAIDGSDNLYVADGDNHRIRKITPQGVVSTVVGTGERSENDGIRDVATVRNPFALCVDSKNNIYFTSYGRNSIRKVSANGNVTTLAQNGGYLDGLAEVAKINAPTGIAVDKGDNIFVADAGNGVVREITFTNGVGVMSTFAGIPAFPPTFEHYQNGLASIAKFVSPAYIAFDAKGDIYVSEQGTPRIRKISLLDDPASNIPPTPEELKNNWNKPKNWN